jgi:hypothetical protein
MVADNGRSSFTQPVEIDEKDSGVLPGIDAAVRSILREARGRPF